MGAEGGMRTWLTEGKLGPEVPYISREVSNMSNQRLMTNTIYQQDKEVQKELFSPETGGFAAPINYYKAALHGIGIDEDKGIESADNFTEGKTTNKGL